MTPGKPDMVLTRNAPRKTGSAALRMPAEWEPHAATWLAWPHNQSDWPGKFEPVPHVYVEIVRHLCRHEHVHVVVKDRASEVAARKLLSMAAVPLANLSFHRWVTNRGWLRDSGPIFVKAGGSGRGIIALNWRFNAWAKYSDWKHDNLLPERIARFLEVPQITPVLQKGSLQSHAGPAIRNSQPATASPQLVLEGGSIDVNGCGSMLTTRECLLSETQARNPGVSQRELEKVFARYLGVQHVIWLGRGISGDDTHGHVDDIARFVAPRTVVAAVESNRRDVNWKPLQENLRALKSAADQEGRSLTVVELPMPSPVVFRARRLPASYANFYIANQVVLVPTFNDPNDRLALNTLAELFPERDIVPIYCGDLIWGLGAIHCMTQQQPK
jgi:agmatine deiminase